MESLNDIPVIAGANDGDSFSIVGDTYRILISGKQTGDKFAVIDMLVPPGGGPGPHAHAGFQESFYVVDGEVEVKSKGEIYTAKKGDFVSIPLGGMAHSFKNRSDTLAHLLCTVVPSGLEEMFLEIGKPIAAGKFLPPQAIDEEGIKRMKEIAEKYGQQLFSTRLPGLNSSFIHTCVHKAVPMSNQLMDGLKRMTTLCDSEAQ